jgi:pyruvate dehydrogenase E2 component (dihydrolipoamide acetyltransferase)
MAVELKMPALSPTMEEGTLAKWLVKEGDSVKAGDLLAEIETDKATMEFEAVDEGIITQLLVAEGTDAVKVGTVIARIAGDDETVASLPAITASPTAAAPAPAPPLASAPPLPSANIAVGSPAATPRHDASRVIASPLARRLAEQQGINLSSLQGTGPAGRIVKADLAGANASTSAVPSTTGSITAPQAPVDPQDIPHEIIKLSNMRKTIARRLTEAKQTIPHIYLTLDCRIDALLKLRTELNAALEPRGIKLSVNDLVIKALALALIEVPACNVSFAGDQLIAYARADIAVAVAIPGGLITPIVANADGKSLSEIAVVMNDLASRAKDGKLQPHEYQGGTASLSNMGMFGIAQFDAVINPPQAMILAVGAGEKRAVVDGDQLAIATLMTITGSFDHRAIDGADGARLMGAIKRLIERPLGLVA